MSYTGGLAKAFKSRHDRGVDDALEAAAYVIYNGLKEPKPLGLTGGYTSGNFVTGFNVASLFVTPVFRGPSGNGVIFISTDNPIALYWEMGHFNLFSRKYEREERWGPTASRKWDEAMRAYHRVYSAAMT